MPRRSPSTLTEPVTPPTALDAIASEVEAHEPSSPIVTVAAAAEPAPDANVPAPEVIATAEAMRAAREVLEAAEAEYRRMEDAAGRAASEDQARRDREEDQRIARLQADLPWYFEQAKHDELMFRAEVVYLTTGGTMERVMRRWIVAASTREIVRRIVSEVYAHSTRRSEEDYRLWDMRVQTWHEMIQSATSRFHGGVLDSEDDDVDALAAVNAVIAEQSAAAPLGPIDRKPDDTNLPGPAQLGIIDRSPFTQLSAQSWLPLDFHAVFNEALIAAAMAQAQVVMPRSSGTVGLQFPTADQLPRLIAGSKVKLATMRRPETATSEQTEQVGD